jgi:hypothetical protein
MKHAKSLICISIIVFIFSCGTKTTESKPTNANGVDVTVSKHLFLDVHNLEPGKVTFEAVAGAHQKDLATQDKFGANFIKYWVDEKAGKVYCLAEAPDSASIYQTHKEAHGLVPDRVHQVSDGPEASPEGNRTLFLDIHELGAGNVTEEAVAGAHVKDLATQSKYDANFINYWVDVKSGTVMCLVEANDSTALINTHKEAHGLLPNKVREVKQGQ